MRVILNIGLKIGRTNETITLGDVTKAFRQVFGKAVPMNIFVHRSDTEPTAVVSLTYTGIDGVHGYIRRLARATQQEVIPTWKPERQYGSMLGPTIDNDDDWGEFDPKLFIMPDGSRLGDALPAAA